MSAPGATASQCSGAAGAARCAAFPGCPPAPARAAASATTTPVAVSGDYLTISEAVAARQLFVSLDSAMPAAASAQASRK